MDSVAVLDLALCAAMTTLRELVSDVSAKVCGALKPLPFDEAAAVVVPATNSMAAATRNPPPMLPASLLPRNEPFATPSSQSPRRTSSVPQRSGGVVVDPPRRPSSPQSTTADPSTRPARVVGSVPTTTTTTAVVSPPEALQVRTPTITPGVSPQITPNAHHAIRATSPPTAFALRDTKGSQSGPFETLPPRLIPAAAAAAARGAGGGDEADDDAPAAFSRRPSARPLERAPTMSRLQRLNQMGIGALGQSLDGTATESMVCPGS